jgi:hypothetical protein
MECEIDDREAGLFSSDLKSAAKRFCAAHPKEKWKILGKVSAGPAEFTIYAAKDEDDFSNLVITLPAATDTEQTIFLTLEELRESKYAS